MADVSGVNALLDAAAATADGEVRAQVIRTMVRFGLGRDEWMAVGGDVVALAELPPGAPGRTAVLSALADVPLAAARRRLGEIAADRGDPDHELAAALLRPEPSEEDRIDELVEELKREPLGPAVATLATRPIEDYGVDPELFRSAAASTDSTLRLWGAVARGRLGDLASLTAIVAELDADNAPPFMWGDPSTAYEHLAAARPVPDAMHEHLLTLERPVDDMNSHARLFVWALTGTKDAEGHEIRDSGEPEEQPLPPPAAPPSTAEVDPLVDRLQGDDCLRFLADANREVLERLADLPKDVAGRIVVNVVEHLNELDDHMGVLSTGNDLVRLVDILGPEVHLPVERLLTSYLDAAEPRIAPHHFAYTIAHGDRHEVMSGLARMIADEQRRPEGLWLLNEVAEMATSRAVPLLDAGPPTAGAAPPPALDLIDDRDDLAFPAPPDLAGTTPPPAVAPTPAAAAPAARPPAQSAPAPAPVTAPAPVPSPAPATRTAHPRLDCDDVVVIDLPFDVVIGLGARRDRDVTSTGAITLPAADCDIDLLLSYDPGSLAVDGPPVRRITVTAADPYPATTVRVTALDGDDLADERRLGVHYIIGGTVVGFAWRTIVAVPDEDDRERAPRPAGRERELLDLGTISEEVAPDLVVAVFRADTGTTRFTWSAFPTSPRVAVPDVKRSIDLGDDGSRFATNTRRTIQQGGNADARFDWLHGMAKQIGSAIPTGIADVIRAVAAEPDRTDAPTVLLLTEEVHVPWEIASLTPALETPWGGTSPFLGAHVALGRWLLSEREPRPRPAPRVEVTSTAVVTAKYDSVARWPALPAAEREAVELERCYPPARIVQPLYGDVMKCLRGDPPADVMHFALHGQFDPDGIDEGLVLLAPKEGGGYMSQYLQAAHVNSVEFVRRPFVFLNACQVGATKEVLGDYAGMAGAFLRAGAAAVIAPLWNVDDDVASKVARQFYDAAYAPGAPPVSEILRRIRATYTRDAVVATAAGATGSEDAPPAHPTLVAYQFFGHPRLRLTRGSDTNGDNNG